MSKQSTTLTVIIAAFAATVVLLATFADASARNQRANAGAISNHAQSTVQPVAAKNDHGHRHHRHDIRLSRLMERPVYCNCSYESCPEWVLVQCVGHQPRRAAVRPPELQPRCICSGPDLMDPNYD